MRNSPKARNPGGGGIGNGRVKPGKAPATEPKFKSAAILTIRDADKMTPRGRKAIAKWLTHHAEMLLEYGPQYSGRFTGRYQYAA